jgi:DNA polymerase
MTDSPPDLDRLRRMVLGRLESLQRAGVATLAKPSAEESWLAELASPAAPVVAEKRTSEPPPSRFDLRPATPRPPAGDAQPTPRMEPVRPAAPSTSEPAPMPRRPAAVSTDVAASLPLAQRVAALEAMRCEVAQCTLCKELVKSRTQTVFGVGNPQARIVFFGEAPGADEDRTGEPFVGRAGQLLTKIIEACGFQRDDVYIMNVLRCRPPGNRTPQEDEVENCRHWFEGQFNIIRPEYIVCVGTVPTKALIPTTKSIGQMRGKFHEWKGTKVLCTYHPAYLLRNPDAKKLVWDDMKFLLADMGLEVPKPKREG